MFKKYIPPEMVKSTCGQYSYMKPSAIVYDGYYTHANTGKTLFSAIRSAIRNYAPRHINTLNKKDGKLWEVDNEYLFITDEDTAKRAQLLLVKAQRQSRPVRLAYVSCPDLKSGII